MKFVSFIIQSLQGKQESLVGRLDQLDQENEELRGQVDGLEESKEQLEESLERAQEQRTRLNQELNNQQVQSSGSYLYQDRNYNDININPFHAASMLHSLF